MTVFKFVVGGRRKMVPNQILSKVKCFLNQVSPVQTEKNIQKIQDEIRKFAELQIFIQCMIWVIHTLIVYCSQIGKIQSYNIRKSMV